MLQEPTEIEIDQELVDLTGLFSEGSRIDEPVKMLAHFAGWFGRRRQADVFVSVSRRGMPEGTYKITRQVTAETRELMQSNPSNPWRDWASLPAFEGGVIGELIREPRPRVIGGVMAESDPALGELVSGMRTAMAIPTFTDGEALNWAISFYTEEIPRDTAFVRSAMIDINMLGMATRNLVTRREAERLNTMLSEQLERIANIQRSLLPQRLPKIPGLELATSYLTSNESGGDYYDFFPFPDGRWGILIADVAGHGAPAATVMAMLRGILHCYERADFAPASVMNFANTKLLDANLMGTFVTAFFAIYDDANGALEFARCGHNPPRIRRADGSVIELDADGGLPLGIDEDMGVRTAAVKLDVGDTLVLYTDGITEAFSGEREMFGVGRLDDALRGCSGAPECVVDSIHQTLYKHTQVMDRDDDQTLVIMQRVAR